jgi:hypothetical protein
MPDRNEKDSSAMNGAAGDSQEGAGLILALRTRRHSSFGWASARTGKSNLMIFL